MFDETARHPPRLGKRGQQQGVQPDDKTSQQTGYRTGPRPLFPVHATEHRRGELGDRGKGNQADTDQGVSLASGAEIDVAEEQDEGDGGTPDANQQAGKIFSFFDEFSG